MLYKSLIRKILFRLEPEHAHELVMSLGQKVGESALLGLSRSLFKYEDQRLEVKALGLTFPNPFGLAAGADKDGRALSFLASLGFGHIEVGTITPRPQAGNDRPRIFRVPEDEALINRMGFPSEGALVVGERLLRWREKGQQLIIGANIGKMKDTPNEDAIKDYLETFKRVQEAVDYIVVNVSSPNTQNLRQLQERSSLRTLLHALQQENKSSKPLLVKVAPDLERQELGDVVETALECRLAGIVVANTTITRAGLKTMTSENGGLSGRPLFKRTQELVEFVALASENSLDVVGVGGVFSAEDALVLSKKGAKLIQLYTGLVYNGPFFIKRIKRELIRIMNARGLISLREVHENTL